MKESVAATHDLLEYSLVRELSRRAGPGLSVTLTDNAKTMISVTRKRGAIDLRLSRIFSMACAETVDALIGYVTGSSATLPARVRRFIDDQPLHYRPGRTRTPRIRTKGAVYNLREIAGRINRRYFEGTLRVKLTWGRRLTGTRSKRRRSIQYGSYDEVFDLIRIHPALDDAFAPVEFVELVVYHEMLHKQLGSIRSSGGRRMFHTPEFRKREAAYEGYGKAIAWEKSNFNGLLRRIGRMAP